MEDREMESIINEVYKASEVSGDLKDMHKYLELLYNALCDDEKLYSFTNDILDFLYKLIEYHKDRLTNYEKVIEMLQYFETLNLTNNLLINK